MDFGWMAWTTPTAVFFATIGSLILGMCIWEWLAPGGAPRDGILGLRTTRGDRLFLTLLLNAFLAMGWLALAPVPLWWVLLPGLVIAILIFLYF